MDVLRDILDNLSDSIVIIDSYGQIVLFNNEALRIHRSISDKPLTIGEHVVDLENEGRKKTVSAILKTLRRQKKPVKNFAEYVTPSGRVFLQVTYMPVLGAKKELRYVNIISQDITARKIFESKLRDSTAEAGRILENAHALVVSIDSRGYIVEWNKYCADLTGFSKKEILSRNLSDILAGERPLEAYNEIIQAVIQNRTTGSYELSISSKNGNPVIVTLSATCRLNANGQVIGATLVGHDITELTTYRRSLEKLVQTKTAALRKILSKEKEAVEMKNRFVSIASHEFRTPLSSIDFAANFIKRNAATIGSKKLNEKVTVIEKHVNYMSHLLEDVLNYSRNEDGKIQIFPTRIDLDDFFRQVVEEVMCSSRHSHHICVSTNALGSIVTDEKLLRNILINLLTNAIKFSPDKEEISLNVLDQDDFLEIEVRDEGIGIPEEELDLIFEPFIRGKSAEKIKGTGLGLSIAKKAVELLEGNIEVRSTAGKGSVFIVTIPHRAL